MKKISTVIIICIFTICSYAQAPQKMSYQAVIRDTCDALITNSLIGMQISIIQSDIAGAIVYSETQTQTSNINGLVSLEIGTGETTDDFAEIDWSSGPYFIKTETDLTGGNVYTITGISQLLSVPYALYAETTGYQGLQKKIYAGIIDTTANGDLIHIDSTNNTWHTHYHYKTISIPEINSDSLPLISVSVKPLFTPNYWVIPSQTEDLWINHGVNQQNGSPNYSFDYIIGEGEIYLLYKREDIFVDPPQTVYTTIKTTGEYQITIIF